MRSLLQLKLPALKGGGSDLRQCFAAGSVPVNIALRRMGKVYNRVIPFRQYLSLCSGLCLVLGIFSGCAGFGKHLEVPRIALANIQVKEVQILESVFQIDLRVFNTNEVPLDIKGIECDLEFNGRRFATGVSKAETKIPSYETALISMMVYSSVLDVMRGLQGLSSADKIEYNITGRLRLGAGAMPAVIPFKSSGEVSLEGLAGYK
jgi:LEA14-like dessication related protein